MIDAYGYIGSTNAVMMQGYDWMNDHGCVDSVGSDGFKTGGRVPDLMGEAVDVAEVEIRH
jgi:hypothetical protein